MVSHVMNTYARLPVAFASGKGAYLTDTDGKEYLDGLTGLAVVGLGHADPTVAAAISAQAETLTHTSNLYEIPSQSRLADRLCGISGMEKVFFANSGAEANEAAIKLARLKGSKAGLKNPSVLVMDGSFHGRTMATLTATGNRKVHAGFEPLLSGFARAPFDDVEAVQQIADNNPEVVALLVEPVLGEGGIYIAGDGYLEALRKICDEHGWLMMLDEIQTGNGRTGKYFAYQHTDILPDVLTTAKGLGNGMPIGVCLARGEAAELFVPGNHGSTFGGNPLACAAGNAVLDVMERDDLINRAADLGDRMLNKLRTELAGSNRVKEIRGLGLMLAVELNEDAPNLVTDAMAQGVLINVTQGNIVRMLPPLTLTDTEADKLVDTVVELIRD
ncbi:MAG: acetylornithine/succinylornithine family transaminase [Pseudomonadales bacterium]|nr:acetylornithine/succinylornithine family transaminase [Pseudomonadales bacterium]